MAQRQEYKLHIAYATPTVHFSICQYRQLTEQNIAGICANYNYEQNQIQNNLACASSHSDPSSLRVRKKESNA